MKKYLAPIMCAALALSACNSQSGGENASDANALDIPEVANGDINIETMKSITEELSSDAYEGRAPGSEGEKKTIALLTKKFEEAGLKPGNGDSWLQEVPLVSITAKNVTPLSISGGDKALAYEYRKDMVVGTYQEQANIAVTNSDMVFVGFGINAPEKGWNDYEGVDVKGKTVIILVNDPDYEQEGLEGDFNGRAMTYYGRWTYKYEEAARQGAAAAIIVHDTFPAAYGWEVVESSWTGAQFFPQSENGGADQTMANGWVQKSAAEEIFANAGQDFTKLAKAAKSKDFKAVDLGLKASVSFENTIEKTISHNIIGILPGAKRPDEYVLYTAHWGHFGRCKAAPDGDDICNGAVDNATGTAALVAIAEAQAKAGAPDRSMVFLAVTAEESGLIGSKFYAQNPVVPLAQTVGGVNMDALSVIGKAKDVIVIGKGKSQLDSYLDKALAQLERTASAESTPEKGFYYRSDHFSFAKFGVPMIYMEGGTDLVEGGKEAGEAANKDYTEKRYHGAKDEFDPNWAWDGIASDLQLYYLTGRMMAMSTSWPNWNEGDEFRAARDESRKAAQ